ncbi:Fe-S cluster assembly protein HesB [Nocardioides sp. GY 10113]|uniref:Fe-S cluster assembly protein HesB n=1 Tax=Nocardioides sp. GY 10113 TaxID=2569761 RepID=UPI0010A8938B|nr:Fe-S cluster assembly protein HesB [Nocardioides sp. GY 10113]TIC87715.1 Fe-S cluster assembly protein HesB [Nocardioides sp. GY 10113]
MLALTENAATIVKQLTADPAAEGTPGLRISGSADDSFAVTTAHAAEPDDAVVAQDGAVVYLDPHAAAALDDKILDAGVDDAGKVEFGLYQQG